MKIVRGKVKRHEVFSARKIPVETIIDCCSLNA
jgi:hypothetical protein